MRRFFSRRGDAHYSRGKGEGSGEVSGIVKYIFVAEGAGIGGGRAITIKYLLMGYIYLRGEISKVINLKTKLERKGD